jgi:hypothetical protein
LTQNPETANYSTVSGNYSTSTTAETETIYTISSATAVTHTLLGSGLPAAGSCETVANSNASAPYILNISTNSLTLDGTAYTTYPVTPGGRVEICVNSAGTNYVFGRSPAGTAGAYLDNMSQNAGNNQASFGTSISLDSVIHVAVPTTIGHMLVDTGADDTTGTTYTMVGIISAKCAAGSACPVIATTGAVQGNTGYMASTGFHSQALASSVTLPPGDYIVITCTTATSALRFEGSAFYEYFPYSSTNLAGGCTSSGFGSTVTLPSSGSSSNNNSVGFLRFVQ